MNITVPQSANLKKRLFWYLVFNTAIGALYTVLFYFGMHYLENDPVTIKQAAQAIVEALTTAGFGGYAPWQSWEMNLLVLVVNITGVLIMFLGIPLFVIPMIHQTLQPVLKDEYDLEDHVIICSSSRRDRVLRDELAAADVPYVVVDNDEARVRDLQRRDVPALHGDPEQSRVLKRASIDQARALAADMHDKENAVIALLARSIAPDLPILASATQHETAHYSKMAGSNYVISARRAMGVSLARRGVNSYAADLIDCTDPKTAYQINIRKDGQDREITVGDLDRGDDRDFVAGWVEDRFHPSLDPETTLSPKSVLYTSKRPESTERIRVRTISPSIESASVLILGAGTTGTIAETYLTDQGHDVTTIDQDDRRDADHTGDATDPEVLRRAGIEEADVVLLALDDDETTIYSTLTVRECSDEDARIIARLSHENNVWKVYEAGADFALSLQGVTGKRFAQQILGSSDVVPPSARFTFVRTTAREARTSEAESGAHEQQTIVAVLREGRTIFRPDDIDDGEAVLSVRIDTSYGPHL